MAFAFVSVLLSVFVSVIAFVYVSVLIFVFVSVIAFVFSTEVEILLLVKCLHQKLHIAISPCSHFEVDIG